VVVLWDMCFGTRGPRDWMGHGRTTHGKRIKKVNGTKRGYVWSFDQLIYFTT
jgi:hypothetical protein